MSGVTDEMLAAWAAEAIAREEMIKVLEEARGTTNEAALKLIAQFDRGLLTSFELEYKLREVLAP